MGGKDFKRCNFTLVAGSAYLTNGCLKLGNSLLNVRTKPQFFVAKSKMWAAIFDKCQSEMLILIVPSSCP